jgi:hypothetical protein
MEECRAETVALFREFCYVNLIDASEIPMPSLWQSGYSKDLRRELILSMETLRDLTMNNDHWKYVDPEEIEILQYVSFLLMARAGLLALEYWDPVAKKHGQAHMQARLEYFLYIFMICWMDSFRIGIVLHLIKEGIVWLEEIKGPDGKLQNLYIRVDQSSLPFFLGLTHKSGWSCGSIVARESGFREASCRATSPQEYGRRPRCQKILHGFNDTSPWMGRRDQELGLEEEAGAWPFGSR